MAGGTNLYGFANGDPVNNDDPFGLCVPYCAAIAVAASSAPAIAGTATATVAAAGALALGVKVAAAGVALSARLGAAGALEGLARGGTYLLRDAETGDVMRTGRTNDLLRREGEHLRDRALSEFRFEVDKYTDSYAAQRGREQMIHDEHQPPLDKINPISPKNLNREEYLRAGKSIP